MKNLPSRTCIGCNTQKSKEELIRIVKSKTGEITVDKTNKMPGRGAYICNNKECFEKAMRSKKLEKCFKMKIDESVYKDIQNRIGNQEV